MKSLKAIWARLQETTPWKAWKRYGVLHGNILAGGVGYFAFFSLFPAVALAATVFGIVLRSRPDLIASIASTLSTNLPGFVKDASHPNGIISVTAPSTATLSIAGAISVVSLALAGLGWVSNLRESIRAMFRLAASPANPVITKLRDLAVLVTLGLGVAISAVLTSAVGSAATFISSHIGLGQSSWIVTLAGLVVGVCADTALMLLFLRVLTGIDVPWRVMLHGAIVGGVGFTVIKYLGARLFKGTLDNPLFASLGLVVGLLVWLNLISRLTLVAAAWAANDVDAHQAAVGSLAEGAPATAVIGTVAIPIGPEPRPQVGPRSAPIPVTFGQRATDRVTLGAGALLGVTAAVGAGAAARGIRSVLHFARRPHHSGTARMSNSRSR